MSNRLYLKVALPSGDSEMLMDVTVSKDGSYEVNKMVFEQEDLATKQKEWVVFPKEHYAFRLRVLKDALEAQIAKAKTDPDYNSGIYENIIKTTTKDMIFQDGH